MKFLPANLLVYLRSLTGNRSLSPVGIVDQGPGGDE